MASKIAVELKVGDVIMPPPRELSLWMRRHIAERGLSESALHLTITSVREGTPDKRGRWLIVTTVHSSEWANGLPFRFKVRPETLWNLAPAVSV